MLSALIAHVAPVGDDVNAGVFLKVAGKTGVDADAPDRVVVNRALPAPQLHEVATVAMSIIARRDARIVLSHFTLLRHGFLFL